MRRMRAQAVDEFELIVFTCLLFSTSSTFTMSKEIKPETKNSAGETVKMEKSISELKFEVTKLQMKITEFKGIFVYSYCIVMAIYQFSR